MPDDAPRWRPDPTNGSQQRWYDGFKWTSSVRPLPPPGAPLDNTPPPRPAAPTQQPPPTVNPTRTPAPPTAYPTGPANAYPTRVLGNYRSSRSVGELPTVAMVLSINGLLISPLALAGLILGIIALAKRSSYGERRGRAITAVVAGVVGIILSVTVVIPALSTVFNNVQAGVADVQAISLANSTAIAAGVSANSQGLAVTAADLTAATNESGGQVSVNGPTSTDASGGLSAVLAVTVSGRTVCVGIDYGPAGSTELTDTGVVPCVGATTPSSPTTNGGVTTPAAPTTIPAGYTPLQMTEAQYLQDIAPYVTANSAFTRENHSWIRPTRATRAKAAAPFVTAITTLRRDLVTQTWPANTSKSIHSLYLALGPFDRDIEGVPALMTTSQVIAWDAKADRDVATVNKDFNVVRRDLGLD